MGEYRPQITFEKGVIEGTLTTIITAVAVGFMPQADPIEVAGTVGVAIGVIKMARNWFKNRKGSKQ